MDIQKLKYFLEIARTENISKAAKTLYVGQPSLSIALKRLEEELNTILFERKGRSLRLSDEGKKILPLAAQIVELTTQMEQITSREEKKKISLVISEETSLHNFKDMFEQAFPAICIDFQFATAKQSFELLKNGKVDLVVTSTENKQADFQELFCFELPLLLCVPKTNPLANKKKISFIETKEETFIFLLFQKTFISFVKNFAQKNDYEPRLEYATADPLFVFRLLKQGRGITTISEYDAIILEELDISIVEVTDVSRKVIGYSTVAEHELSPEIQAFCHFFIQYYHR